MNPNQQIEINPPLFYTKLPTLLTQQVVDSYKFILPEYYNNKELTLFIFDLADLLNMESQGIGFLVTQLKLLNKLNKKLALCKPSKHIRQLLMIAHLETVFQIFEDVEQAKNFLFKN